MATLVLSQFREVQAKLTNSHLRRTAENKPINQLQRAYSSMKKHIRGKVDLSEIQREVPLWEEKFPCFNVASSEIA